MKRIPNGGPPAAERASNSVRPIEVHIQELVLYGFAPSDRRPIADAMERELHTLLTREGLPAGRSFEIEHVNGGSFHVKNATRQESAGADVARAIYGGLRQ